MSGPGVRSAEGMLGQFAAAGVLAPADVHVARRLAALAGEDDQRVLLAVALTVRGTRNGSVVTDLRAAPDSVAPEDPDVELPWPDIDDWLTACAASPLVTGAAGGPPLRAVGDRVWLDRYWQQEVQVADDLLRRAADRPDDIDPDRLRADLDELFPGDGESDQRRAVETAALRRVAVIAGGPGTGKTTTVARLIAALHRGLGDHVRIALAAPTGKAAARLAEAVQAARGDLTATDRAGLAQLSAATLHRLLGWRPGTSSRFKHDRTNHLPYDVIVVDEASMVSLTMMARLLEALGPHTRLVLVGDPDQLVSVEAGAVLGDLVGARRLRDSVAKLERVRRFDSSSAIGELAGLVRRGDADEALALLRSGASGLAFHEVADDANVSGAALETIRARALEHEQRVITAARAGDVDAALDALDAHRLLCAHDSGPRGVRHWGELARRWLGPTVEARGDGHYAGQPLLVTANDYEINLFNGYTGVVIARGDDLVAAFRRGGGSSVLPLVRLGEVREMHAMTVHRAQGSQFAAVTVLLPIATSPLATRQTLYTAVTRAAQQVTLVGSAESVLACVARPTARATGLRDRLDGTLVSSGAADSRS